VASRRSAPPVVTLLTDFGQRDVYAGVVKGAILRALPDAHVVDLSHGVRPQDVREAAFLLESAYRYFPPGTVHLVVVDPGVGSSRRIIAAEAGEWRFLGPDNGVLSCALEDALARERTPTARRPGRRALAERRGRVIEVLEEAVRRAQARALPAGAVESSTFHGRDRFAPLAAALAAGASLEELGRPAREIVRIALPEPRVSPGGVAGEVVYVDGFGNLVTNLRPEILPRGEMVFELAGATVAGLARAYVEREPGELVALVGSTGRIEIAARESSAAEKLRAGVGTAVLARAAGSQRSGT